MSQLFQGQYECEQISRYLPNVFRHSKGKSYPLLKHNRLVAHQGEHTSNGPQL
jgi:hypothetical protein